MITKRLKDALALVDIRVLDHFIVTAGDQGEPVITILLPNED
jgi:DNA repair protein RadC